MTLDAGDPESVGDYRLVRRLGAGGMGVVYLAESISGRRYAVKLIRSEYADDAEFRSRFRREVAAARRVSGAFTAPVVDADPDGEPPWLATQFIPGDSLARRVAHRGPILGPELATIAGQLAEALRGIHREGLVHRDLKPGNVLLAEDGPRVIDFGITRAVTDSRRLTKSGVVLGTPPYMAPEQFRDGEEVTAAADVFALGAVVTFAATGHSPFEAAPSEGNDPIIIAYRVVHEEPNLDGLPQELHTLVRACLDKDPARRPGLDAVERMAAWAGGRPAEQHTLGLRRGPEDYSPTAPDPDPAPSPPQSGGTPSRTTDRWRRRMPTVVAAVAVVALITGGFTYWVNSTQDTGSSQGSSGGGGKGAPAGAKAAGWEVDLVELGVPDALESGFACTAAGDGDLLCTDRNRLTLKLDPADGSERWRYEGPPHSGWQLAAVEREGTVYAESREGDGIVALDLESGKVRRSYAVPDLQGRMVTTDSGVIVQNGDKELRLYDVRSPRVLNTWRTESESINAVAAGGKEVLVVGVNPDGSGVPQLETSNHSLSEHFKVAGLRNPQDPDPEVPQGPLTGVGAGTSALYLAEGIGTDEYAAVHRHNTAGNDWQRVPLKTPTDLPMTAADDFVYAPAADGTVTAVDGRRDRIAWRRDSGARGISEVAVHERQLLLTDGQGRLHALNATTGAPYFTGEAHRGSQEADADQHAPAPVVIGRSVYAVTPGNTLYRTALPDQP